MYTFFEVISTQRVSTVIFTIFVVHVKYFLNSVTTAKLATPVCICSTLQWPINYHGTQLFHLRPYINRCYFILTGQHFSLHLIFCTLALRMELKTTYKAPGITGSSTLKTSHICKHVYRNKKSLLYEPNNLKRIQY